MGLIGALINIATGDTVTEDVRRERMSHCKTCTWMRHNTCKKCGCYLPLKTQSPDEQCPLNYPKWDKIEKDEK